MKRFIPLIIVLILVVGYHIYRRQSTEFFYVKGEIKNTKSWSFNEERYGLLSDGFRVEKGNFIIYTDEIFKGGYYIFKLRFLGIPILNRTVDYPHRSCWGFPGIPGNEANKKWPPKGEKRFKESQPIVDLYKQTYNKSSPPNKNF